MKVAFTRDWFFPVFLIMIFVIAACALVVYGFMDDSEDKRETRIIGGLECVYNVTTDSIEACDARKPT